MHWLMEAERSYQVDTRTMNASMLLLGLVCGFIGVFSLRTNQAVDPMDHVAHSSVRGADQKITDGLRDRNESIEPVHDAVGDRDAHPVGCKGAEDAVRTARERISRLSAELDVVNGSVPIAFPEDLPAEFASDTLQHVVEDALTESGLPIDGDPRWDCQEFPCIVSIDGELSIEERRQIVASLPAYYRGEGVRYYSLAKLREAGVTKTSRIAFFPSEYGTMVSRRLQDRLEGR